MVIEKYGVDEKNEDALVKAAASGGKCPLCGSVVEVHGNVVLCPLHGSYPFEREVHDKKGKGKRSAA